MKFKLISVVVILIVVTMITCKRNKSEMNDKASAEQNVKVTTANQPNIITPKDLPKNIQDVQQPKPPVEDAPKAKPYEFSLKDLSGKTYNLKDYIGKKVVFINIWAHWCGPCRREIPVLVKLQEEMKNDVQIISIAAQSVKEEIQKISKELKINYPVLWEEKDNATIQKYQIRAFPTSFIINKKGEITEKIEGGRSYEDFKAAIQKAAK